MDTAASSDPLAFCRPHCKPEIIAMLECVGGDDEYRVAIKVLQECHSHHEAFLLIVGELNDSRSNPSTLASLMNEIRQYDDAKYRADIAQYVAEKGEKSETHAHVLALWLEIYQMWSRAIT